MKTVRFLAFVMSFFLLASCGEDKEKTTTETVSTDTGATANTNNEAPASTIVSTPQHMMLVKHRVKNYDAWLPSFEAHDSMKLANGLHNYVVGQKVGDPTMLFVSLKADNIDRAIAFSKDPSLRQAMQKGGVTGAPDMSFVTIVWQDTQTISSNIRSLTTFAV